MLLISMLHKMNLKTIWLKWLSLFPATIELITTELTILSISSQIQEHLSMLQQQYQDSVSQREGLKERKSLTALRLTRASVLITALSDEKVSDIMIYMEMFSSLLALCEGNPPVSLVDSHHKGPVMQSFDMITYACPNCNKNLTKLPLQLGHGWMIISHRKI